MLDVSDLIYPNYYRVFHIFFKIVCNEICLNDETF